MPLMKTCGLILSIVVAALAAIVGLYWPSITRWRSLVLPPEAQPMNMEKCRVLEKDVWGCEDIVVHDHFAFLSCGNIKGRLHWFPPLGWLDASNNESDPFYVYDLENKRLKKLKILGKENEHLSLHGISVRPSDKPNKVLIAAINHKKSGSCVEIFEHRTGTDELIHAETVCDPVKFTSLNSVVLMSRKAFYVTNFAPTPKAAHPFRKQFDLAFQRPTSTLVYRGEDGSVRVVREGLRGANGLELHPNGKHLYLAECTSGELDILDIQADGSVRVSEAKVILPHNPDNVRVNHETGELLISGPSSLLAFFKAAKTKFEYTPHWKQGADKSAYADEARVRSLIVSVSNATRQFYGGKYAVKELIHDTTGEHFSLASVAAPWQKERKIIVGGPFMHGVYICDWPSPLRSASSLG